MMTINELRTKRAKAWESAKAFLDSHRNEKGVLSAEDDAAYTRMEQEITDLGKEIARLERQEALGMRNWPSRSTSRSPKSPCAPSRTIPRPGALLRNTRRASGMSCVPRLPCLLW